MTMPIASTIRSALTRVSSLFRKDQLDRELSAELESHLQLHIEDNLRAGMSPAEARRIALIKLGGLQQTKESFRDSNHFSALENSLRDCSFALRFLAKNRRVSLFAIVTLALGIGSATIVFGAFYNVLLKSFPYKDFDRVLVISIRGTTNVGGWKGRNFFSASELRSFREQNRTLQDLCGFENFSAPFDDGTFIRVFQIARVTPNFFDFHGVEPLAGHTFSANDQPQNLDSVFVMNFRLWHKEFLEEQGIIGRTFLLDGKPRTLIAIMPPQFDAGTSDAWIPVNWDAPGSPTFSILARAKPSMTHAVAADLDAIAHQLQTKSPSETYPAQFRIEAVSYREAVRGNLKQALFLLLGAVLLLLLIACSNTGNLLLSQAAAREREIAMRYTLGANRSRIARKLFAEASILAGIACLAGCSLAFLATRTFTVLLPPQFFSKENSLSMNLPVLFFSIGLAVVSTFLCSLAPTLHSIPLSLSLRLSSDAKGGHSAAPRASLRSSLVVLQVALSFVLMLCSGVFLRSFLSLTRTDFGFDPKNILYIRPYLPRPQFLSREKQNAFTRDLLERIATLPHVTSVAESALIPPLGWDWSDTIIPGRPHEERWPTKYAVCSEGFFSTFQLTALQGKTFSESDVEAARRVAVVNDIFAKTYFTGESAIGKQIKLQVLDRSFLDAPHDAYFEIVGIVPALKSRDDSDLSWESPPQVYIPYSIQGFSHRLFFAKTSTDAHVVLQQVQRELRKTSIDVGNWSSGTIEDNLGEAYRQPRFELIVLIVFSAIAMLLTMVGVFAAVSYNVSLKIREIGIRRALGAPAANILRTVVSEAVGLTILGLVLGIAGSAILTRILHNRVPQVSSPASGVFAVISVLLITTTLLAGYFPARRASKVDPMVALRYE